MSNSEGSYATTPELYMRAFDKLPKALREAFHEANENYVPQPSLTRLKRGAVSVEAEIAAIKRWDAMNRAERIMSRVWGRGHPQAIRSTSQQIARWYNE